MVLDAIGDMMLGFIAIVAALAAVAGVVNLGSLFHNKLKDLFNDVNYFIFFFLVTGYSLYALGEVSYYLTLVIFKNASQIGIQDLYWLSGGLLILISFITMTSVLMKEHGSSNLLIKQLMYGGLLTVLVLAIIFGIGGSNYSFSYIYPIISALIVSSALVVIFLSNYLGDFGQVLFFLFLASTGILAGDLLFHYSNTIGGYGMIGLLSDLFYLAGYGLSLVAFVVMRFRIKAIKI